MTERSGWVTARRHLAPYLRLIRLESPLTGTGVPDVLYYARGGVVGWIENKADLRSLTLAQVMFAEDCTAWSVPCHMLLRHGAIWALLDPAGTRATYDRWQVPGRHRYEDLEEIATVWTMGTFPLKPVLACLT